MITLDFETRSACDLTKAGAWRYSEDPTTQVVCAGWSFDGAEPGHWHRAHPAVGIEQSPFPQELADRVASGEEVEAHNAFFERAIWQNSLRREFPQFPSVADGQWRCSAAKSAAMALPRKLELACKALDLPVQKDMDGRRTMLKVSKPRKARKAEVLAWAEAHAHLTDLGLPVPPMPILWNEDLADLERTWAYNLDDVRAEVGLSRAVRDLSPREMDFWRMDQRMNERGIACDFDLVAAALDLADDAVGGMNVRLRELTDGAVGKASERAKVAAFVRSYGVPLPDTTGDTVDSLLERSTARALIEREDALIVPATPREVLEICREANRTSTSKYQQMVRQASSDGVIRDTMMYHGASTGRWAGKGVQPHNFVRGFSREMDEVCADILTGDPRLIELLWGSVMEVLAKACRGALVARQGRELMVADYSAIEARCLFWLAQCQHALDVMLSGGDIYCDMATAVFQFEVTKKNPYERQVGKTAILGLGYEMGHEKFSDEAEGVGIVRELEFFREVVRVYRKERYPEVTSYWRETESAAILAVQDPGSTQENRLVRWGKRGRFLHCRLPSGRLLSYYNPKIQSRVSYAFPALDSRGQERNVRVSCDPKDDVMRWVRDRARASAATGNLRLIEGAEPERRKSEVLTFMATDPRTKQWKRTDTYGGKLVENVTQATARDLMAEAMLRAEERGHDVLMSVHDELVCEVDEGEGDVHEFERMMSELPPWAIGCPVTAEGWRGHRYRK